MYRTTLVVAVGVMNMGDVSSSSSVASNAENSVGSDKSRSADKSETLRGAEEVLGGSLAPREALRSGAERREGVEVTYFGGELRLRPAPGLRDMEVVDAEDEDAEDVLEGRISLSVVIEMGLSPVTDLRSAPGVFCALALLFFSGGQHRPAEQDGPS